MDKDNGFSGSPSEQSYDDFLKEQQEQMAQDMSEQSAPSPKAGGGEDSSKNKSKPKENPIEGDFQIDDFSGEGGYDSYLAGQSGLSDEDDKKGKNKSGGSGGGIYDGDDDSKSSGGKSMLAGMTSSSVDNDGGGGDSGGGSDVLDTKESAGSNPIDGGGEDAGANAGLGSKIGGAISGSSMMMLNGIRNMFSRMGGAFGQVANTIGVSVKVLTLATALVGGGGLTILGITVFGGPDYERYVAPADCHVQAKVIVEYTDNDTYHPMTQKEMDGNAMSIYKALSSKELIDGIIGYDFIVGDNLGNKDGTNGSHLDRVRGSSTGVRHKDPRYDDRSRLHNKPEGSSEFYRKLDGSGAGEWGDKDETTWMTLDGDVVNYDTGRLNYEVWLFDRNLGKAMWDHGPATLKDTDDAIYNVIPGYGARVEGDLGSDDAAMHNRITTGLLPGLADNRQQVNKGFTDEAVLGMILNAEAESNINPGCWEAMQACFYYCDVPIAGYAEEAVEVNGVIKYKVLTAPSSGGSNPGGKDVSMASSHHRNWNAYVLAMQQWWADVGMSIGLDSYHYTDRNGEQTDEYNDMQLYYPGVGLWQWTGPRAYALSEFANLLMSTTDSNLDTDHDAMYQLNTQLYYVLFENYSASTDKGWKGGEHDLMPVDFLGKTHDIVDVNKQQITTVTTNRDQSPIDQGGDKGDRVTLIDWGITDRVKYTEEYWVNIPFRPIANSTEDLYGRRRTSIHSFDGWKHPLSNGNYETNHGNLVRPQFDYVYANTPTHAPYSDSGLMITDDSGGNPLRKVNPARVVELYHLMLNHAKRPATHEGKGCLAGCSDPLCTECVKAVCATSGGHVPHTSCNSPKHSSYICGCSVCTGCVDEDGNPDCTCANCPHDCDPCTCTTYSMSVPGITPCQYGPCNGLFVNGCKTTPCYHQCQLDQVTNVRDMMENLMKTWYDSSNQVWWYGLEEADFLDVGTNNSQAISCGDIVYKNYMNGSGWSADVVSANKNLTCFYVSWYYDVSVEMAAKYSTGEIMMDVDVMNQQGSDDTVNNGNAWRPDNVSYNGQPNDRKKAGDQIIYESTPEAVAGYVQGYGNSNYSFSDGGVKDKASNHIHPGQAGTDTGPDGYSNQSHSAADTGGGGATGWIRSTLAKDQFGVGDNLDTLFYMMREYGSTTKEWSNYGQYKEKNNSDEKVALDGIPGKTTDAHWIGWTYRLFQKWWGQDDSVTGLHGSIKQTGSKEFTDRYYRLRLAGHSLGASLSYGWQDKVDGNTTTGQKLLAKWSSGTGPRKWPDQPVEPTIKDLGKGQDCGGDTIIAIADATSADGNGIYGSEDYKMLRNISDDLMWWAESRAIAQVSRIPAREFTKNWEGMGDKGFADSHSKFGSSVHYSLLLVSDRWAADKNAAKSILDAWYEDINNMPLQTFWRSFYRNYCATGEGGFGGIAEMAVSWAWPQGHPELATVHDTSLRMPPAYKKTYCTELYVAVKDILDSLPTHDPIPNLYSSCDRGVATAVRAAGADDNFSWGACGSQIEYANGSEKWECIGLVNGLWDSLEPGDLLLSRHHVIVFVGGEAAAEKWPSLYPNTEACKYGVVHSSLSADLNSSRGPRFDPDNRSYINSAGDFYVYRLVGEPDTDSSACRMAILEHENELKALPNGSTP